MAVQGAVQKGLASALLPTRYQSDREPSTNRLVLKIAQRPRHGKVTFHTVIFHDTASTLNAGHFRRKRRLVIHREGNRFARRANHGAAVSRVSNVENVLRGEKSYYRSCTCIAVSDDRICFRVSEGRSLVSGSSFPRRTRPHFVVRQIEALLNRVSKVVSSERRIPCYPSVEIVGQIVRNFVASVPVIDLKFANARDSVPCQSPQ